MVEKDPFLNFATNAQIQIKVFACMQRNTSMTNTKPECMWHMLQFLLAAKTSVYFL